MHKDRKKHGVIKIEDKKINFNERRVNQLGIGQV
jgi:hypothetical protein